MRTIFFLTFLLLVAGLPGAALAEKRVALVIGNSAYQHVPQLANPKNDATDMTAKLEGLGFEVVRGEDLDLASMRNTAREFTKKLEGADISLFFYAGHGLQVNGTNYIAPVDAKLASYDDLEYEAMPMDLILTTMERKTKVNLVFLDACRDNPLAENLARSMGTRSGSVGRGLAKLGTGVGSLIAFATQPGNVALDGDGRNSPFTTALLKHLGTPGQSITDDLIQVRKEVLDATQGKQVPWDNSSLTGPVILKAKPAESPKPEAAPESTTAAPANDNSVELAFWDSVKDSDDLRVLDTYLKRYPTGTFADLARVKIDILASRISETEVAPSQPDQSAELAYWNSIKDSNGSAYFEAYLAKYPQGQFADLARIRIDESKLSQTADTAGQQKTIEIAKLEQSAVSDPASELARSAGDNAAEAVGLPFDAASLANLPGVDGPARKIAPADLGSDADPRLVHAIDTLAGNEIRYGAFRGNLYIAVLTWGGSWNEARLLAERAGGHLVTLGSKEENRFVYDLFIADERFVEVGENGFDKRGPWIGLFQPEGSKEPKGGWQWVTGERLGYTSWTRGQPNNYRGKGNAGIFYSYGARGPGDEQRPINWDDDEAGAGARGFILEIEGGPEIDHAGLTLEVQRELARLGCLQGSVDGKWGSGSERALGDYAGRQGIKLASLQPTPEVLDRLKATTVRVCPLICGKGTEDRNGRCEKVKREAKVEPKPEPRGTPSKPTKSQADKAQETQRKSAAGNGRNKCYICVRSRIERRLCTDNFQQDALGMGDCKPI